MTMRRCAIQTWWTLAYLC